ncbi:hypothetical protein [Sphingorhabdus sp. SMR4y]|uniref:hypothetical protein n=1 Tax=Sphingorhabdus sp. SMR4y TaxID=2584094 RepID=UPI000B61B334|nr:hypothetical protein [Sphingorhabdus sp. SMR4y]ASK88295.1 hypothetical protein SPHFLASMR4Y_01546 [Sphingorhabdus sp. SMR4y]
MTITMIGIFNQRRSVGGHIVYRRGELDRSMAWSICTHRKGRKNPARFLVSAMVRQSIPAAASHRFA